MERYYYLKKIHNWLKNNYGKANKCEFCKIKNSKRYEWAKLKDKEYDFKRENFIMLCCKCHRNYDMTDEHRENIRLSQLGNKSRLGTKTSLVARKNMSLGQLGKKLKLINQ